MRHTVRPYDMMGMVGWRAECSRGEEAVWNICLGVFK